MAAVVQPAINTLIGLDLLARDGIHRRDGIRNAVCRSRPGGVGRFRDRLGSSQRIAVPLVSSKVEELVLLNRTADAGAVLLEIIVGFRERGREEGIPGVESAIAAKSQTLCREHYWFLISNQD